MSSLCAVGEIFHCRKSDQERKLERVRWRESEKEKRKRERSAKAQ
jgi:hypothetical protein